MKALITGIGGMDAAHLSKLLLDKGLEVYGTTRPQSDRKYWRLEQLGIKNNVTIIPTDLSDFSSVLNAIGSVLPDYVFNLAAQSHVGQSFTCPQITSQINGQGAVNVFEACKRLKKQPRIYQASTSEMYGNHTPTAWGLDEKSSMNPISPYGAAKLYAHNMATSYRQQGYSISCGILFNHESPLRGSEFVTQKIIKGIKQFKLDGTRITLGNLDAKRDWGHAAEYVAAMWKIINAPPDDYVVATGSANHVRDFLFLACEQANIDPDDMVTISNAEKRPNDIEWLLGNPTKIWYNLQWKSMANLKDIIGEMLDV